MNKRLKLLEQRQREHELITPTADELPNDATPAQVALVVLRKIAANAPRARDRLAAQGLLQRAQAGEFDAPADDDDTGYLLAVANALRDSYEREHGARLVIDEPPAPTPPADDTDISQLLADTRRGSPVSRVMACRLLLETLRGDYTPTDSSGRGYDTEYFCATVRAVQASEW